MKTVYVMFGNHFDLLWRRCWERDYVYQGMRFASYARVEELILNKAIDLAEQGEGAYGVEEALTMRAYLKKHPDALPRVQALYEQGLFEMYGAGEAIIDVNMCSFETMVRNMASGTYYCREVLGMPPLLANHGDGFGSSAQFPQVMRECGYPGISGLSYCYPDNRYWRGLDGSTVLVGAGAPGRGYFYDHCYHEPCRVCKGMTPESCEACQGMGIDLPQNFYPPFEPVTDEMLKDGVASYSITSEEMLPPENFSAQMRAWEAEQPGVRYIWGTGRNYAHLWKTAVDNADNPPTDQIASRVENNPVQTGCLVSRIRIKQMARRSEAAFYGWEKALALTALGKLDRARWEEFFLELPLAFFHDSITGTHQDEAYAELMDRMGGMIRGVEEESARVLGCGLNTDWQTAEQPLWVFNPNAQAAPVRVPLPVKEWRQAGCYVAVAGDGRRFPIVMDIHAHSPNAPEQVMRSINATGPDARTRPATGTAFIETDGLVPLAWTPLRIEPAAAPTALDGDLLQNDYITVKLGEHGVESVTDIATNAEIHADLMTIGEVLLEEDEGDPWGTRKFSAFRREMREYTRLLGTMRFDGYQEAYYFGRYEPSLRFGREQDPAVFALDWYVTVRLLDNAKRVDFQYEIFWKSSNRRVRVAFPTQADTDTGWYSIPGGMLPRERYEQTETCLWSPNGDWPALYYVASQPVNGAGWAVMNYGTPAARIEDGRLLVSLLRSPGFGHCLERYAQDYPMPTSGIRDNGWHHFTLSLQPFAGEAELPNLSLAASALNQAPPSLLAPATAFSSQPGLRIEGDGVELTCVKPLFDQGQTSAQVIRLINLTPAENRVSVALENTASVQECNALEQPERSLLVEGGRCMLTLKPFETKTLCIS
ncbi:MAG: glycoside hydrolase family 38 N-terminal domain-containing protein [Armatimonadota bacterium]